MNKALNIFSLFLISIFGFIGCQDCPDNQFIDSMPISAEIKEATKTSQSFYLSVDCIVRSLCYNKPLYKAIYSDSAVYIDLKMRAYKDEYCPDVLGQVIVPINGSLFDKDSIRIIIPCEEKNLDTTIIWR